MIRSIANTTDPPRQHALVDKLFTYHKRDFTPTETLSSSHEFNIYFRPKKTDFGAYQNAQISIRQGSWGKRDWNKLHGFWGKRDSLQYGDDSYEDDEPDRYYEDEDEDLEDILQEVKRAWNNLKGNWGKRDWSNFKGNARVSKG